MIAVSLDSPRRSPEEIAVAAPQAAAEAAAPEIAPAPEPVEPVAPPAAPEPSAERKATPAPTPEPTPAPAPAAPARPPKAARDLVELPVAPRRAIERFPRATGAQAEAATKALERIFKLGELNLRAEVLQGEDRLEIEVWGEDQEQLLEDRGRLLLAVEHLLPRLIRGFTGESSPCRVDCDNFHEIRAEQLRDMAQRAASEVRDRDRSKTLPPMSPDERRIIHLTLTDDPAVETESQGNGLFKRVTVRPAGSRSSRGFDPYRR
jgi:spoIIIJ-associated protein